MIKHGIALWSSEAVAFIIVGIIFLLWPSISLSAFVSYTEPKIVSNSNVETMEVSDEKQVNFVEKKCVSNKNNKGHTFMCFTKERIVCQVDIDNAGVISIFVLDLDLKLKVVLKDDWFVGNTSGQFVFTENCMKHMNELPFGVVVEIKKMFGL